MVLKTGQISRLSSATDFMRVVPPSEKTTTSSHMCRLGLQGGQI